MSQQNVTQPKKKPRWSKKSLILSSDMAIEESRKVVEEKQKQQLQTHCPEKSTNKRKRNGTLPKSNKKPKTKAPSQATSEAPSESQRNESVRNEATEASKHYDDHEKLHCDWNREKDKLLKRYFISFAEGRSPDARLTEVAPLSSCKKCTASVSETSVNVYFLNSKNNAITVVF
jgi:hypothetical protein